jgi:hypothetical protein
VVAPKALESQSHRPARCHHSFLCGELKKVASRPAKLSAFHRLTIHCLRLVLCGTTYRLLLGDSPGQASPTLRPALSAHIVANRAPFLEHEVGRRRRSSGSPEQRYLPVRYAVEPSPKSLVLGLFQVQGHAFVDRPATGLAPVIEVRLCVRLVEESRIVFALCFRSLFVFCALQALSANVFCTLLQVLSVDPILK